jgi:hypothetical protein
MYPKGFHVQKKKRKLCSLTGNPYSPLIAGGIGRTAQGGSLWAGPFSEDCTFLPVFLVFRRFPLGFFGFSSGLAGFSDFLSVFSKIKFVFCNFFNPNIFYF